LYQWGEKFKGLTKSQFLAINTKGGESISPKQKDRTTTFQKILIDIFQIGMIFNWYIFKISISIYFQLISIKTLLKTKRRISFRGSFVKSKEKHLKQGEKISNIENASQNLIHIPLTICKKIFQKNLQKQNKWCKRGPKC
jgi:hypothetical protein